MRTGIYEIGLKRKERVVQNPAEVLIRIADLHKSYYDGESELRVLQGINLEVYKSELLAIVGASGVGEKYAAPYYRDA